MYMLVHCVDREIGKNGVYTTWNGAFEAMMDRITDLTGERPMLDETGYGWVFGCGSGEVNGDTAYVNCPRYGGSYDYDWAILEV